MAACRQAGFGGSNFSMPEKFEWSAQWIQSPYAIAPSSPLPIFRKEFDLRGAVARAEISICGLGHFELHLNGHCVGEDLLSPAWTNYAKTCLYMTYDVASMLHSGANCIG